jgi:predicted nucleic acid-binding protein
LSGAVLDASVFGPLLIPDEADNEHPALADILRSGAAIVPSHWHLEVANLGRSAVRRRRLAPESLSARLADFEAFDIEVDRETPERAWHDIARLAQLHELTPYDAAYLELALRRDALLLCDDAPLARAAKAEGVELL